MLYYGQFGEDAPPTDAKETPEKKAANALSYAFVAFVIFSTFQWPRAWGIPKKGG